MRTVSGHGGAVTAPHFLATEAGLEILREGGTAVEAAVAVAATLAVVYPHMNSIGGDSFWLISKDGSAPIGVDACGRAALGADLELYRAQGMATVPWRGPLAANTVNGTLSGWRAALEIGGGLLPLSRLLEAAIHHARAGVRVAPGLSQTIAAKRAELEPQAGFASVFLPGGQVPETGSVLRQPALAETLTRLAAAGLDDAYRGEIARLFAEDLAALGAPVTLADLQAHSPGRPAALHTSLSVGELYNTAPPTQGLASLMILALFDRLSRPQAESFGHIHGLVEATKRAFQIRDRHVGDPDRMSVDAQGLLDDQDLMRRLADDIDPAQAMAWPSPPSDGDTVWFGAMDDRGGAVSAIQSTYFEFGSGLVLPQTGVTWQNRGASFRIAEQGWNALAPGRKPFHTLNPAMARLKDGRMMAYGNMGGEGQPQSQAAVFSRYALYGQDLQAAITAPRWLLGRTWGENSTSLKLEGRFDPDLLDALAQAGHAVEVLEPFTSVMGHAGALVRHPDGCFDGASDPRSDGAALTLR